MKTTVSAKDIKTIYSLAKLRDNRTHMPALDAVRIEANGRLEASSTDLYYAWRYFAACDTADDGVIALDVATIKPLGAGKGEVSIATDGVAYAAISANGSTAKVPTFQVDQLPWGPWTTTQALKVNASLMFWGADFDAAFQAVDYARCHDDTRPHLCAMRVDILDEQVKLVTTDGHRMACANVATPSYLRNAVSFNMPGALCKAYSVARKIPHSYVRIDAYDSGLVRMQLIVDGATDPVCELYAKGEADQEYPSWRQVVPAIDIATQHVIECYASDLAAAIKAVLPYTSDRSHGAEIIPSDGSVTLRSTSQDTIGSSTCPATIELTAPWMPLGVNLDYLREAIGPAGKGEIRICPGNTPSAVQDGKANLEPIVVTCRAVPGYVGVVMPMRI